MTVERPDSRNSRTRSRPGRGKAQWGKLAVVGVLLAPSLVIFILYRILPMGWNLALSFQKYSLFGASRWIGLDHYVELWGDEVFWAALRNTLIYLASAPIGIAIALVVSVLVSQEIRGRNIYRTMIFVSYPLMTVAVGVIWRWLYDEKVGLFNYVLRAAGVIDTPIAFLESFDLALPAVIAASIWQVVGFYMVILLAGLQSIPQSVYEAASIDGAGPLQQFFRITLPLLRPSLFLTVVVAIMHTITSFDLVYVMTQGGPGHSSELLITYIYKAAFQLGRIDYAAAITVVQFALLVALTWLANRLSGGNAGAARVG